MNVRSHRLLPVLILLSINLIFGLLSFEDQGISWDEPFFYDYATAIRGAYTSQVVSPTFDFNSVYGKSAEDHKFYGPAFLLIAQPLAQATSTYLGVTIYKAWHLVNFLTFQIGLLFFYLLMLRWVGRIHAVVATAFFAWQPLFWGHAFNNPKDIPFLVFFLITIQFGFRFIDPLPVRSKELDLRYLLLFSIFLGLTTSIRVIGPVAGLVVLLYLLFNGQFHKLPAFFMAATLAILVMIVFWPYLWADPINNLVAVLKHMSNNPTELAVLFDGQIFRANAMPITYIPKMLFITLTEPTWFLVLIGSVTLALGTVKKEIEWQSILPIAILFLIMVGYILLLQPAVYDGFRHFFFISPILFLLAGLAIQFLTKKLAPASAVLVYIVLLSPGVIGIIQNHPYEYSYYNQFVGGTSGAFRNYETDYWLTCYQPSLGWLEEQHSGSLVAIQRELQLAQAYSPTLQLVEPGAMVEDLRGGSFLLAHTRANLDQRSVFRKLTVIKTFGVGDAQFCQIKKVE